MLLKIPSLGCKVTIRKSESENKLPISLYILRSGSFSNTSESEDASSWKLEIPGYKLAKNIKRPDAVRAIASAAGKNPVGLLVPCHRVVKKNGDLGGYMWGEKFKRKILDIEGRGTADSTYRGGK